MESILSITSNCQIRRAMLEETILKRKGFGDRDTTELNTRRNEKLSLPSSLPSSLHSTATDLGEDLLRRKNIEEGEEAPRPRPRYQRRNSAVASMLFSSAFTATRLNQCITPRTLPSLQLSSALGSIGPLEALRQAKELLDRDMPPPLVKASVVSHSGIKRVVSEDSSSSGEDAARKRQRVSESA
jgi:hypothetical protein